MKLHCDSCGSFGLRFDRGDGHHFCSDCSDATICQSCGVIYDFTPGVTHGYCRDCESAGLDPDDSDNWDEPEDDTASAGVVGEGDDECSASEACSGCGVSFRETYSSYTLGGVGYCHDCAMARGWDEANDPADPLETCDGCGDKGSGDSFFEGPDGALYYCPSCADDMGLD